MKKLTSRGVINRGSKANGVAILDNKGSLLSEKSKKNYQINSKYVKKFPHYVPFQYRHLIKLISEETSLLKSAPQAVSAINANYPNVTSSTDSVVLHKFFKKNAEQYSDLSRSKRFKGYLIKKSLSAISGNVTHLRYWKKKVLRAKFQRLHHTLKEVAPSFTAQRFKTKNLANFISYTTKLFCKSLGVGGNFPQLVEYQRCSLKNAQLLCLKLKLFTSKRIILRETRRLAVKGSRQFSSIGCPTRSGLFSSLSIKKTNLTVLNFIKKFYQVCRKQRINSNISRKIALRNFSGNLHSFVLLNLKRNEQIEKNIARPVRSGALKNKIPWFRRLAKTEFGRFWLVKAYSLNWFCRPHSLTYFGWSFYCWRAWRIFNSRSPIFKRYKRALTLTWPRALKHRALANLPFKHFNPYQFSKKQFELAIRYKKIQILIGASSLSEKKKICHAPRKADDNQNQKIFRSDTIFPFGLKLAKLLTFSRRLIVTHFENFKILCYHYKRKQRVNNKARLIYYSSILSLYGSQRVETLNLLKLIRYNLARQRSVKQFFSRGLFLKRKFNNIYPEGLQKNLYNLEKRQVATKIQLNYKPKDVNFVSKKFVGKTISTNFINKFYRRCFLKCPDHEEKAVVLPRAGKVSNNKLLYFSRYPRQGRGGAKKTNEIKNSGSDCCITIRHARRNIFASVTDVNTGRLIKVFSSGHVLRDQKTSKMRISVLAFKRIQFALVNFLNQNKFRLQVLRFIQDCYGGSLRLTSKNFKQFSKFLRQRGRGRNICKILYEVRRPHSYPIRPPARRRK